MRRQVMSRTATQAVVLMIAAFAAALSSPMAEAAGNPLTPLQITPSSGCGQVTVYTAGTGFPDWSGPAPSCGAGPFTLAFNQGNTPAPPLSRGVGTAGSALLAWFSRGVPEGARMGYQITASPGITINKVVYDIAQLQNIADGHGWIGFTYWNGETRAGASGRHRSRRGRLRSVARH
jgi:hypothetical protein